MQTFFKIDPDKRMYRWYAVGIQNTLVDGLAVIYGWGSTKSSFQQWRTIQVHSFAEAEKLVTGILEARIKKGYIEVKNNRGNFSMDTTMEKH